MHGTNKQSFDETEDLKKLTIPSLMYLRRWSSKNPDKRPAWRCLLKNQISLCSRAAKCVAPSLLHCMFSPVTSKLLITFHFHPKVFLREIQFVDRFVYVSSVVAWYRDILIGQWVFFWNILLVKKSFWSPKWNHRRSMFFLLDRWNTKY